MAQATNQRSPWPMRIGIAALLCILLGGIGTFSQTSSFNDAFSPIELSELSQTGDGLVTGELDKGCHTAYTIKGSSADNVTLSKIVGSQGGEILETSKCKTDYQAMDTNGEDFVILSEWDVDQSGEYALELICSNQCDDTTVWLVNSDDAQWKIFDNPGLIIAMSLCCLGFMMIPVIVVVYFANRGNNAPRVMMISHDGKTIPLTDLTPETVQKLQQEENVSNPFADTGITDSDGYVDGREDVEKGRLLTTEQVFALMKGDVDEAQNRVSDPFADYNKPKITPEVKKPTNTKEISLWDEGHESTANPPKTQAKQTMQRQDKSSKSNEKPAKSNDWKKWDEN